MSSGLLVVTFMAWCAMGLREGGGQEATRVGGKLLLARCSEVTAVDVRTGRETVFLDRSRIPGCENGILGRPYYSRQHSRLLVPVGSSWECTGLVMVDRSGNVVEKVDLGRIEQGAIVLSPDEQWLVYHGQLRGQWGTWAVRVGNWSQARSLPIRVESALDMTWSGGAIYYSWYTEDGEYEVWRYEWETGEVEKLPWRGEVLGMGGHDPEVVLWRKSGSIRGDEVWGWRRGTPIEQTRKLWEASTVGRSAAVMGPGYVVEGVRLVNGWFVDWAALGAMLTEGRGLYWVVPGRKYAPRIGPMHGCPGIEWMPNPGESRLSDLRGRHAAMVSLRLPAGDAPVTQDGRRNVPWPPGVAQRASMRYASADPGRARSAPSSD